MVEVVGASSAGDVVGLAILGFVCVASLLTPQVLSLRKQFTFYASFHNDPVNQFIHFLCIWPILWTALVFFANTSALVSGVDLKAAHCEMDVAFFVAVTYAAYYVALERQLVGVLGAIGVGACYTTASYFAAEGEALTGHAGWKVALAVHIVAWVAQLLGHGIWEKRTPALTKNFAQAVLMAPIFVLLEASFLFGYRREFRAAVMVDVQKSVNEFKRERLARKKARKAD